MITVFPTREGSGNFTPETSRRVVVARACATCHHRKVKCDGLLPCYNCRAAGVLCRYHERQRRNSKKRRNTGASDVDEYAAIARRLFGETSISTMKDCSRDELLNLLVRQALPGGDPNSPSTGRTDGAPVSPVVSDAVQRLQMLEDGPSEGFEWDESDLSPQDAGSDDVNALSLATQRHSSFLGIFSVAAVVRVLVQILPASKLSRQPKDARPTNLEDITGPSFAVSPRSINPAPQIHYHESQRLIDAYFSNVHVFAPIVHEPTFRTQFLTQSRKDTAWLSLFYMVLALGSIASSTSESVDDIAYYRAAQAHLGLDSFGSGHLETLQGLILMGGMYLHYRNRPNMASAIMGAVNRMACGLGLHRESHDNAAQSFTQTEIRRRTWWSSYVLDSWGSITLGRPNHITKYDVRAPRNIIDDQNGDAPADEPTIHSPLIYNITLCKMLARIQLRLQTSPILDPAEIASFDKTLVDWFRQLPSFMHSPNPCPTHLQIIRDVFNWRYQSIRILLHRAVVLDATIRQLPWAHLGEGDQQVVAKCRELAADSIACIRRDWQPTKMSGWNAVWFLFQACLIPLMALATEPAGDYDDYLKWRELVEVSIGLCREMSRWSLVGEKTSTVLNQLLKATEKPGIGEWVASRENPLDELLDGLSPSFFDAEWNDVIGWHFPSGFDQSHFIHAMQ